MKSIHMLQAGGMSYILLGAFGCRYGSLVNTTLASSAVSSCLTILFPLLCPHIHCVAWHLKPALSHHSRQCAFQKSTPSTAHGIEILQPAPVRHHLRPGNSFLATCSRLSTADKSHRRAAKVPSLRAAAEGTIGQLRSPSPYRRFGSRESQIPVMTQMRWIIAFFTRCA